MHQLIQFRQLTSELTKSELKQLFSTLIEDELFDEQFIITSMFTQMYKILFQSKTSPIKTINNTITDIINEREVAVNDSSENTPITFDSLSSTIINEIGSYLTIKEICNCEKTNRRNFISMRYPYPALYSIGFDDPCWMKAYSKNKSLDFAQFKGVKKLVLNGQDYYKLKDKPKCHEMIFSKVENLCFYGFSHHPLPVMFENNNSNYTSLENLSFIRLGIGSIEQVHSFKKLLTNNKDLKSLQLQHVYNNSFDMKIDATIISQQLSKLKALSIRSCDLEIFEQITQQLNHQIESLHIGSDMNVLTLQKGYPNLKEICVSAPLDVIEQTINKILKTSRNIQQINFQISNIFYLSENELNDQFPEIMQKLAQLSDLKLLQLRCSCYIGDILRGINKFLMNHKRDIFKLVIQSYSNSDSDEQILNLIAIMNTWITQFSFVFICTNGVRLKEETINILKQIVNVKCYEIGMNQTRYNDKRIKYIISSNDDIYIPCIYACINHLEYEPTCGLG